MSNEIILIKDYDYVEFSKDKNIQGQTVLAIYGIENVIDDLEVGSTVQWDETRHNKLTYYENENGLIWNGKVYAIFNDFVLIYLF
jgi:hypothetical protein